MFPSPQTSWVGPLLEISRVLAGPAASHTDSQFPRVPIGRRTGRTDLGEMLCNCLLMWTRGLSGEALPSAAASVTSFHAPSFRVVRSPRTLISGRSLSQGPGLSCIEASVGSGSGNRSTRLTAFDQILSTLREKRHKLGLTKSVLLRMDGCSWKRNWWKWWTGRGKAAFRAIRDEPNPTIDREPVSDGECVVTFEMTIPIAAS